MYSRVGVLYRGLLYSPPTVRTVVPKCTVRHRTGVYGCTLRLFYPLGTHCKLRTTKNEKEG